MKHARLALLTMIGTLFLVPSIHAAQFNFTPTLTVSEEYNDNIFLTADDEEDDFITRATIGCTLELLGKTAGLELTYLPSYEWYDDFSENDGWTHDASGRLWKNLGANTTVELRNAFLRTRDSLSDASVTKSDDPLVAPDIENDRLRQGRQEYYQNTTTARLDHQFGAEDTVYTSFRYAIRREVDGPEDDEWDTWEPAVGGTYWFTYRWGITTDLSYSNRDYKEDVDREEWIGRLRMNYRITRHLSAYAQYEHIYLDYDQTTSEGTDDYRVHEPTIGVNYQLDKNTRIDVGAGWYFQDKKNFDDDDGFALNASADKVWPFRRGLFGVTLLSGLDIDDKGSEDLGLNRYASLSTRAEYAFTPRFSGNANVGYRWDDYPDQEPDRTDYTLSAGAGLQYQALRWMFVNLDYTFRDLSTDDEYENDEYTENRVLFSITLRPEQPFRLFR